MDLPVKEVIAQGGLGVVLVVALVLLGVSIRVNWVLVKWVRDLYEKHTAALMALVKEQQQSAEADRTANQANTKTIDQAAKTVAELSSTVQSQGSLLGTVLQKLVGGGTGGSGGYPATRPKEPR